MTDIPSVSLENLFELCRSGQFEVCRISDIQFDPNQLEQILSGILQQYSLIEKDGYETYKAICLQHREGSADLLYGDVGQMRGVVVNGQVQEGARPRGWCMYRNEIGEKFSFLWEPLQEEVILLRGRIIQALPGFEMSWHHDGPDNRRIHIPIRTNPQCQLEYRNGHSYHMPADGSVYIVNATNEHRAVNRSDQPRTHITFSFLPTGK